MKTQHGKGSKGAEMLKKRIMAALILIATEDLNAMRVLLKSITDLTSKSGPSYRRS
jgi:hypothetical protein